MIKSKNPVYVSQFFYSSDLWQYRIPGQITVVFLYDD